MKKWTKDELILFYYNELDSAESLAVEQALKDSAELNAEYQQLCEFLDESMAVEVPAPSENLNQRIMANIYQQKSTQEPEVLQNQSATLKERFLSWFRVTGPINTAVTACCLMVGLFFLGRWSVTGPELPHYTSNDNTAAQNIVENTPSNNQQMQIAGKFNQQARQRMLLKNVSLHMQTSDRLLTLVSNGDSELSSQIEVRRDLIRDMLALNRIYRRMAEKTGDAALVELLQRMESVLLDINHTNINSSQSDWENIQKRIQDNDLLYQLRVNNKKINNTI